MLRNFIQEDKFGIRKQFLQFQTKELLEIDDNGLVVKITSRPAFSDQFIKANVETTKAIINA